VDGGHSHTCAVTSGGSVKCWGFNHYGQLGDVTTTDRPIPVLAQGFGLGAAQNFDGDAKAEVGIYRPATGTWFILKSSPNNTGWTWDGWGNRTDTPVPADYDGDGKADLAIFRPATAEWCVKPSTEIAAWRVVFGQGGDVILQGIR
jgi:hypothetical protein